ncbi:aminotransferase class I/II-fold pyridoxal phosphate-dependent enzyme (plasmid) [Streptomyces atratus]|uniref:Histidinol-phosphate aminotransferase n=1 Tax=Streptomyces atratus TaxID=1893 RepID=A0A1K1ZS89_STRAR|nr:aminotransferase class I/II-fold pyridoxal phosphate-dependent enzyme [Streptomyces atratus]SFX77054.1 histidinol-phosphate aminotransferase [Streptomyces atratus]
MPPGLPPRAAATAPLPSYREDDASYAGSPGGLWDLSNNEISLPPLPRVREILRRESGQVHLYPDPRARFLVDALSTHFAVDRESILVGPGSAGVLQQLLLTLCGPGDDVLYATPGFDAYPLLIATSAARGIPVPLTAAGDHDLDRMRAGITANTRVVILCSPHNPTGKSLSPSELGEFLVGLPPGVITIIDQAYVEFDEAIDPQDLELLHRHADVVLLRTFSKAYGLAGLRVGYALAAPPVVARARKTAIPFSVTRGAEQTAIASLREGDALRHRTAHIREERERLFRLLSAAGHAPLPSRGNFLWIPLGPRSASFAEESARAGVKVRAFPGHGVRVTVGDENAHRLLLSVARGFGRADG